MSTQLEGVAKNIYYSLPFVSFLGLSCSMHVVSPVTVGTKVESVEREVWEGTCRGPDDVEPPPKDLEDAFTVLERMLLPTEVDEMSYHFGIGMWMRNNWGCGAGRVRFMSIWWDWACSIQTTCPV